jgi:hypothetical protein
VSGAVVADAGTTDWSDAEEEDRAAFSPPLALSSSDKSAVDLGEGC